MAKDGLVSLLPVGPVGPGAEGCAERQFADDGSLWNSFRDRWRALLEDVRDPVQGPPLWAFAVLLSCLLYSYWPGLQRAAAAWNDPQYSHGWIVPLFSIATLFWWRQPIAPVEWSARLTGLGLLVASLALRLLVARYRIITIDMYTLVPALAGVMLLAGGWSGFRWGAMPIGFLIFMYPLPDEARRYLLGPLQVFATMVSTFAIQTLGIDAVREGNQIIVGERHLGVVDACSGLRMLTIFIALSVAIVMVGHTSWYESLVILSSAIPIALAVNAIRITVTGVMYTIDADLAEKIFHDWAGYFMMPMALGFLFLERSALASIFVVEGQKLAAVQAGGPIGNSGLERTTGNRPVKSSLDVRLLGVSRPVRPGEARLRQAEASPPEPR
ncbi:MAG: exosortase/archaeosortase family protein [Planctomycetia bacterium]